MDVKNENDLNTFGKLEIVLRYLCEKKTNLKEQASIMENERFLLEQQLVELSETINTDFVNKDVNLRLFSPYSNCELNNSKVKFKERICLIQKGLSLLLNELKLVQDELANICLLEEIMEVKYQEVQFCNSMESSDEHEIVEDETDYLKRSEQFGKKIIETQELERKRIARELHDTTVQNLTGLIHKTELCTKLIDKDTIRTKLELVMMMDTIRNTINDMRTIIYDLRPMSLTDLGLVATIESLLNGIQNKHGLQTALIVNSEEKSVLPIINLTLYRVVQEACNNVVKHANASSILIRINYLYDELQLCISDDGDGFNTDLIMNENSVDIRNYGLSIMKERIYLLSGKFQIDSATSVGTKINVVVPYCKNEGETPNEHY